MAVWRGCGGERCIAVSARIRRTVLDYSQSSDGGNRIGALHYLLFAYEGERARSGSAHTKRRSMGGNDCSGAWVIGGVSPDSVDATDL